ncbi:MAG: hypothetical protein J7M08_03170 [Planctomycetes bacterium]|nr:hypothetical protein [Planctomycetota bacterium]
MGALQIMIGDPGDAQAICWDEMLVAPPQGSELRWYCFHTRPRREKKVIRSCLERDLLSYLPLRRSVKHYGGWQCEHAAPYFPGYVFGCVSPVDCYELLCAGDIANVLKVYDQEELLRDLREIEKALRVSPELEMFPYIKRGRRVKVTRGPFRGVEGIVSERRKRFRVALNINFIQRALSIELDCGDVEAV